jgi:hypothetical protein
MRHPGDPNSALLAMGDLLVEGTPLVQMVASGAVRPNDPRFQQFCADMATCRAAQQQFLPMVARHYLDVCLAFGALVPTINDEPNGFGRVLHDGHDDDMEDDQLGGRQPMARLAAPPATRAEATFAPPALDEEAVAFLEDLPNLNAVAANPKLAASVFAGVTMLTASDRDVLVPDSVRAAIYEALTVAAHGSAEPFRTRAEVLVPRFAPVV